MEHKSCCETAYNQPLPSRVIELFEIGDRQGPCAARLVETNGIMQGTYVCLSYCWGDSKAQNQTGRTTSANLSKQLQEIPFDSLPNTVIDAIHLCYKLNFRFLWVDRLCIIQDDKRDWKNEASQMCDIYSRSALTISVPLCIESSKSFLKKRQDPHPVYWRGIVATMDYIDMESSSKGGLCFIMGSIDRDEAAWFLERTWDFTNCMSHYGNRWITRGWTFQEWMLSPRVLHIDTMTLWDCFEGYANELNRRYIGKTNVVRDPTEFGKDRSWDLIVEEYSHRQITYEEDRLPALDGLATRYHQRTGYTYLAGLWLEEMPRSLLWQRDTKEATPAYQTVPSWSWASLNTRAAWVYANLRNLVPPGEPFLPSASIHRWVGSPSPVFMDEKAWIDIKGHISVVVDQASDLPENFMKRINEDCLVKVGDQWWHSIPDHGHKYADDEIAQSNVYLIVLGSTGRGRNTGIRGARDYGGLVLQRCGWDNGKPYFRRLGMATWEPPGSWVKPGLKDLSYWASWELQVIHLV